MQCNYQREGKIKQTIKIYENAVSFCFFMLLFYNIDIETGFEAKLAYSRSFYETSFTV